MRIRYHFIANLHTTEIRSILLLTKYENKNRISKSTLKNGDYSNKLKINQTTAKIEVVFPQMYFDFRSG